MNTLRQQLLPHINEDSVMHTQELAGLVGESVIVVHSELCLMELEGLVTRCGSTAWVRQP